MFTFFSRKATQMTATLTAMAGAILAWTALPAAATAIIPVPGPGGSYGNTPATPGRAVQTITSGGMPGWQITLIAIAAALVAATTAVFLDRARSARRSASIGG
ncbi:MAG: hypothetical protein WAK82_24025 [Streptosporangiaceae bacterium]